MGFSGARADGARSHRRNFGALCVCDAQGPTWDLGLRSFPMGRRLRARPPSYIRLACDVTPLDTGWTRPLTARLALPQARRGRNVDVRLPLFEDEATPEFRGKEAEVPFPPGATSRPVPPDNFCVPEGAVPCGAPTNGDHARRTGGGEAATLEPPQVHVDAMAFGMGCCCLQVTFQVSTSRPSPSLRHRCRVSFGA